MKSWHLVLGGLAVAGGAAAFLSGGDASADGGEPWPDGVDDLKPGKETEMAKQVVCTCYRGGAKELKELTLCALRQIWEKPPWKRIMENSRDGDHPSLQKRIAKISGWAQQAIANDGWCDDSEPPPEEEEKPEDETESEKRKRIFGELISDTPVGGSLWQTKKDDGIGSGGLETIAKTVLKAAGIPDPGAYYHKLVLPLMRSLSAGTRWNRPLYAASSDKYWASNGQSVGYAMYPRHKNARLAILEGRMPERNISMSGNKSGEGGEFGMLWIPKFDVDTARQYHEFIVDDEGLDPPARLLDMLA